MDALLRSQDTNHLRYQTLLARLSPQGDAEGWDGVGLATTGSPLAEFNTAFVTSRPTMEATYDEVVARLEACGGPYTVQVPDELLDRVGPELTRRGLRAPYDVPGMRMRVARHREPELPETLTVKRASSLHDHTAFVETLAAGFAIDAGPIADVHPPQILREPDYAEFVGTVSGEPVATAAAVLIDDVVGVYAVAVPAPYRGNGLGRALTASAVAWGTAQGATTAVLQASPQGEPVYRAMGFRTVRSYHRFRNPKAS